MEAQTNQKQENTRTCEICGEPLERWERQVHLACYQKDTAIPEAMEHIGVPSTFRKTIQEGKVLLPYETFGTALLEGRTRGLLFIGEPGTGKTILSCYVATQYVMKKKGTARYVNIPEYMHDLRQSYNSKQRINPKEFESVGLLVLDDVGAENTTEWTSEMLYLMVNGRYESDKLLIVTTNLDLQSLAQRVGDRIVSRIVGMCQRITLDTQDKRLDEHKEQDET